MGLQIQGLELKIGVSWDSVLFLQTAGEKAFCEVTDVRQYPELLQR